jgi:DNA invertase Pin-like site-specific DNA recombinase
MPFQSLHDTIDRDTAAGERIFDMVGAITHFEQQVSGEHHKDGTVASKARRRSAGRPGVDEDKRQASLKLLDAGMAPAEVARHIGLSRATIYRLKALKPGQRGLGDLMS